jgi:hypothetical protein
MSEPWVEHTLIWPTEAKFMSWVRGGIRAGLWKKHPVKLEFLRQNTKQIVNNNPRSKKTHPTVKGCVCALCGAETPFKDVEVDHLKGNHSLRSMDDLRAFIEAMIMVSFNDLQVVCKTCHKIKSYAEKQGITFAEAKAEKLAISLIKLKKDVAWLTERGIVAGSNQAHRRRQIVEVAKHET